jgi:hypothetical protein
MAMTEYNPQKGRLENINTVMTQENTTWFEDCQQYHEIHTITDFEGGVLIREFGYDYPLWIYDISRADIEYDQQKAKKIYQMYS